jgi:hypothetical protein
MATTEAGGERTAADVVMREQSRRQDDAAVDAGRHEDGASR